MADFDPVIEAEHRRGHHGGGVALHQEPIRFEIHQDRVQLGEDPGGQFGQALVGPHQVQVHIGCDLKGFQHLIEHFTVLGGDADQRFDLVGELPQPFDHGGHLDGFRAGAKNGDDAQF